MIKYFGVNIREKTDGMKLTRENYIKVKNKSSFVKGKIYDEEEIKRRLENSLYNFDLNMKYFHSLSNKEFNDEVINFINKTKVFREIDDLSSLSVSGYYIMVLDEYSQAYIGRTNNIRSRIQNHWSKQKEFDRLIFGGKENSILSIDSFRAYDTTRIYVYPMGGNHELEDDYINLLDSKYRLNRTKGGSLVGLIEAIAHRKTRDLI